MLLQALLQILHDLACPAARQLRETMHLRTQPCSDCLIYDPCIMSGIQMVKKRASALLGRTAHTDLCYWDANPRGLSDGADVAACVYDDSHHA